MFRSMKKIPGYTKIFSLYVGHKESCVKDSIQYMSHILNEACIKFNAQKNIVFESYGIDTFEDKLTVILENKQCDCFSDR